MSGARRRRSHDPARNMQTDGALKAQMIIRKARSLHVWHPVSILSLSDVRVGLHRDDKSEAVLFPLSDLPRFHIDDEVLGLDYGAILLDRDAIGAATKLGNAPVRPGNWEGELELAIAMFRPQSPRTFLARSP